MPSIRLNRQEKTSLTTQNICIRMKYHMGKRFGVVLEIVHLNDIDIFNSNYSFYIFSFFLFSFGLGEYLTKKPVSEANLNIE